jgi:hypothetical protein
MVTGVAVRTFVRTLGLIHRVNFGFRTRTVAGFALCRTAEKV